MEPIVSPWFIYLIMVIGSIKTLLIVGAGVLGGAAFVLFIVGIIEIDSAYDEDEKKKARIIRDKSKKFILPFLIVLVLAILTPSRNTVIAMYVTKFVTTDNITKAIEGGGNFKDVVKKDIIEIIEAMKGEKAQSEKSESDN